MSADRTARSATACLRVCLQMQVKDGIPIRVRCLFEVEFV